MAACVVTGKRERWGIVPIRERQGEERRKAAHRSGDPRIRAEVEPRKDPFAHTYNLRVGPQFIHPRHLRERAS